MLITSAEVTGFGSVMQAIKDHKLARSPQRLAHAAEAGAEKADELISAEMMRPKSGIKWPNLPNRSSSPAEMPAEQSGELIDNMVVVPMGGYPGVGRAALEARSKQAFWMEFGFTTRDGGFHIRPFMRPGVDKNRNEIISAMRQAMR